MKQESNTAYVLRLSAILLAITLAVALLLGAVNALTAGPIAAHNEQKTQEAIGIVLPSAAIAEKVDFTDATGLITDCWVCGEDGYAVKLTVGGSQADITMMVGVKANGEVSGISFISMSETSGLGAVAAQNSSKGEAFRSQFIGTSGLLAVNKDGGQIDALTGATVTSRAVVKGVNAALACTPN